MHGNLKSNLFYIMSIVSAFIFLPYNSQHSATQVRTHISVFTERTNRRIKAFVICFHSHANHAIGSFFFSGCDAGLRIIATVVKTLLTK